ncbi:MAG: hypothetical protein AMXMBFR58_16070 [Phycisphaerae bacterium]
MSPTTLEHATGTCVPQAGSASTTPTMLRRASGATAFIRRSRRGSFLVLVIGVLALISAFMVIYVAVGRADQQLSSAVQRGSIGLADAPDGRAGESGRDAVAERFARYAAQVIADDATATFYVDKSARAARPDGQPLSFINLTREASDSPYTDWARTSIAPISQPGEFFDPAGSYDPIMEKNYAGALPDAWKPSDPWLASTEPVWLNFDAIDDPANASNEFVLRRDWAQISNFAPDGAFVNLYNMRGSTAAYIGNFEATPEEMRDRLSLFDPNGAATASADFGVAADPDVPAYWTMRQRGAAVPVGMYDSAPSSPSYRPYQWADADGDGLYDSRWFEMVDPRTEDGGPDYTNPEDVLGIRNDRFRYFFAARAIDLSALVNVNTATDFVASPDSAGNYPPGATPSDVDLRRLLGLEDVWFEFPFANAKDRLSYSKLAQSSPTDDGRAQNYFGYTNETMSLTSILGNRAYLGMGFAIDRGTAPIYKDINNPVDRARFGKNDDSNGAKGRSDYYDALKSSVDGVTYDQLTADIKSPFGNADLLELLTFRGVNDPSLTSTLESAAGAKYEGPSAGTEDPAYMRYSPLRDNRPLDVERLNAPGGYTAKREAEVYAHLAADVRQRITTLSGARPIKSGDVPVVLDTVTNQYKVSADELTSYELRGDAVGNGTNLINAYVSGLLPYAFDQRSWPTNGSYGQYRFLNYGYRRPEVGLRMAAHLAANFQAMRDGLVEPPVMTVALWDQAKQALDADKPSTLPLPWKSRAYKWSYWPYDQRKGAISDHKLSQSASDNAGDELCADAINVVAVTPQPVITAAASFMVFTDAQQTVDPADNEPWVMGFPTGAPDVQINGDRSSGNADYLGEVFAVQIVNPFPKAITLGNVIVGKPGDATTGPAWTATRNRFDYYLEFAGRYYRLADWLNGPTFTTEVDSGPIPLTLGPSASRVFYFTSIPLEDMEKRFRDSIDTANGGVSLPIDSNGDPAYFVRQWIKTQLGGAGLGGEPIYVEAFEPTKKGQPVTSTGFVDITAVDTTQTPAGTNKMVRLWRAYRDPWEEDLGSNNELWDDDDTAGSYGQVPDQNIENDILIDRLRDPEVAQTTWRHEPTPGLQDVANAPGWDWDSDPKELLNKQNYNRPSGMTFTFAALVARRGDRDMTKIAQTGMLPAYCIESAFGSSNISNTAVRNYDGPAGFSKALAEDDLVGGRILYREEKSILGDGDSWYGQQVIGSPLFNVMGNAPSDWTIVSSTATGVELMSGAAEIPPVPAGSAGTRAFDDVRPMLWADFAADKLRPADVLLPLAIGGQYSYRTGDAAPSNAAELDERWLTLTESWALALNYESLNPNLATSDRWKLYDGFGELNRSASPPVFPATDGGRVVVTPNYQDPAAPSAATQTLSAFVPFVDQDGNGVFDRDATPREDLSLGLTPAMSIMDQFNTVNTLATITRPTLGTINLSTAPLAVLRLLPMLSPTVEDYPGSTGDYSWWWRGQSGNNTQLTPAADLAATVFAYREKGWARRRPDPANPSSPGGLVNFDDRDGSGNPLGDITVDADWNGRSGRSDIAGLREQPGLIAPSEILAATRRYQLPYAAPMLASDNSNIDFLGWDLGSMYSTGSRMNGEATRGITTLDYSTFSTVKSDYESPEDKLLIANAVLNSASTRSDYFAVWFVVAGFRSTDVRGLALTTPMVPSIQRRYVMVVDRSQVVRKGDKPRIVFFREVPMK